MSLRDYLASNFVDKATFAKLAGVSEERLDALIEAGAIPAASYVCDGATITSAAFGAIGISEQISGEYFRPECLRWVQTANHAVAGSERAAVESALVTEFEAALLQPGVMDTANRDEIRAKIDEYLPSFFDGTFGLCVADPSTGSGIIRKEILQERLTRLTENGTNPEPAGISATALIALMDDYAAVAMPFSPAEYNQSSRKRLVDDFRHRVTKS